MNRDKPFFTALTNFIKEQGETLQSVVIPLFFCRLVANFLQLPLSRENLPRFFQSCSLQTRKNLLSALEALDEDLFQEIIDIFEHHQDSPIFKISIDAALHQFYPNFLRIYNKRQWKEMGTFYTNPIIARFMISQINQFWKEEYGSDLATAPPEQVQILDPALGSGVFLCGALDFIREQRKQDWRDFSKEEKIDAWKNYLTAEKTGLLHRMIGIELDPIAILLAEFRLSWQLWNDPELPFSFSGQETLLLYQKDALSLSTLSFDCTLIIGNPPYNSTSKQGNNWISEKLEDYKYIAKEHFGEKKHWLSDDYIKFIRFAQHHLESKNQGVLSFITPNSFLSNPSFRAMRWNLLQDFSVMKILDLQGNHYQSEKETDENIFNIQQGIAISLFGKLIGKSKRSSDIYSYSYSGSKESKLRLLGDHTQINWTLHRANTPYFSFLPLQISSDYQKGFSLQTLFLQYSTGLQTGNEAQLTASSSEELQARFSLPTQNNIIPYLHKPFQIRYLLYLPKSQHSLFPRISFPKSYRIRERTSQYMLRKQNIALHFARSNKSRTIDHFFVSHYCSDLKAVEKTTGSVFAPLYILRDDQIQPNLNVTILQKITTILERKISPLTLLDYIYGTLYNPKYRQKYQKELSIDYPRIPYPKDKLSFQNIQQIGTELRLFHTMEHPNIAKVQVLFPISGSNQIEKIQYKKNKLFINSTQYFDSISPELINFQIGGYPIALKWLKAQKNQSLSSSQIKYFGSILFIIRETIRLMERLDQME